MAHTFNAQSTPLTSLKFWGNLGENIYATGVVGLGISGVFCVRTINVLLGELILCQQRGKPRHKSFSASLPGTFEWHF